MTLSEVIDIAGSPSALARRLGVSAQRISNWRSRGIPGDHVLVVCAAVDWQVRPHDLRPDMYPNPTDGLPAEQAELA